MTLVEEIEIVIILIVTPTDAGLERLVKPEIGKNIRQAPNAQPQSFPQHLRSISAREKEYLRIVLEEEFRTLQGQACDRRHQQVQIVFR
jgi:Rps23 Pro-64 3,4-dihydroxylase Tpa1-like proline 4-hydroxylase